MVVIGTKVKQQRLFGKKGFGNVFFGKQCLASTF
jgi:hypothetical protein